MYFRGQEQMNRHSVLHLSGQLTIQLTPQQQSHFQPNYGRHHFSNNPGDQFSEAWAQKQKIAERKQQTNNLHNKELERRVENIENMLCKNLQMINEQALEALYHTKTEFRHTIKTYDQGFHERIKLLTSIEQRWKNNSDQKVKEQKKYLKKTEEELAKYQSKIEKQIEFKINEMMEQQKKKAQEIRLYKFEQLTKELSKQISKVDEKNKQLQEKITAFVQEEATEIGSRVLQTQNKIEKLQEQIQSKINQDVGQIGVINNKITELKDTISEKLIKPGSLQALIDRATPSIERFHISGNRITLQNQERGSYHKLLVKRVLDREQPFIFYAKIMQTQSRQISIGIVDRISSKSSRYCRNSGSSICYCGYAGRIYHKNSSKLIDVKAHEGMEVKIEVELKSGKVQFTIKEDTGTTHHHSVEQNFLTDENRQFVPFFDMMRKGDTLTWGIE